jgi:methylenetetrahydrofolate reductase (NADPH)
MTVEAGHRPTTATSQEVVRRAVEQEVLRHAAELVACGSIELGAHRTGDARQIAELLPAGTLVYVNHLPRHALSHSLQRMMAVHQAGLEPVPHLAARRLVSRQEAQTFLERSVRLAGVRKILLIGGEALAPAGPYQDAAALLREGLLSNCGVREVGFAGYPEGHPQIATATLEAALNDKLACALQQGLGAYVLTQFSFAPIRIVEYCADLARRAPNVPVYVGCAGPSSAALLLRYAHRCGVSASLRALQAQGMKAVRLITHTDPSEQLIAIARHCVAHRASNIVGVHLYSFGGISKTAAWMNSRIRRGQRE